MDGVRVARIRVVLADDHKMILAVVRSLLENEFEVVAQVTDGIQAVAAVLALDPDVGINGLASEL
jgi:DNA-binding NarL/FixJ family response regulator